MDDLIEHPVGDQGISYCHDGKKKMRKKMMIAPKDELFSLSQNHNIMKCAERGNIQRRWLKELSMLYGPMEHKPSVPHNSYKGDGREEGKKERRNEGREGGGEDLGSTL